MNLELHDLQLLQRQLRERIQAFVDRYSGDPVSWDWENVPKHPSLKDVYCCAVEVLGSPAAALDWLTMPNEEFEDEPPLLYPNHLEVIEELGRISHGVF
jgi:hypothetical protein